MLCSVKTRTVQFGNFEPKKMKKLTKTLCSEKKKRKNNVQSIQSNNMYSDCMDARQNLKPKKIIAKFGLLLTLPLAAHAHAHTVQIESLSNEQ